jgi:hypothetical protein
MREGISGAQANGAAMQQRGGDNEKGLPFPEALFLSA